MLNNHNDLSTTSTSDGPSTHENSDIYIREFLKIKSTFLRLESKQRVMQEIIESLDFSRIPPQTLALTQKVIAANLKVQSVPLTSVATPVYNRPSLFSSGPAYNENVILPTIKLVRLRPDRSY